MSLLHTSKTKLNISKDRQDDYYNFPKLRDVTKLVESFSSVKEFEVIRCYDVIDTLSSGEIQKLLVDCHNLLKEEGELWLSSVIVTKPKNVALKLKDQYGFSSVRVEKLTEGRVIIVAVK